MFYRKYLSLFSILVDPKGSRIEESKYRAFFIIF